MEREKEAKEIRAQGYQEAKKITSTADKERRAILAEYYNKAQQIKGEGDAEAAISSNANIAIRMSNQTSLKRNLDTTNNNASAITFFRFKSVDIVAKADSYHL